ncbi:MAG: drug/metabolite exporter YedA [Nitrosomonadales bacterium]|nr:MAG: drug/metabolite exporter YedA [Nitrosomonadales bacterium]
MNQQQRKQRLLVALALISLYFIWGSTFLAIRYAIDSFPPFMMAAMRFLTAGVLLYAVLRLRGAPNPSLPQWGGAAVVGMLLPAVGNGGVSYAEQWVTTGAAALAIATVPLWAALFSGLWGDWPNRREWLGIALGLLGVLALNLGGNMRASPVGAAVLLLAAAGWAFGSLWSRRLPMPGGAMASAAQMLVGGAVLAGASLLSGEHMIGKPTQQAWLAMAYLVTFGSWIAYSAYLYLLRTVRPILATSYAFVNPLVALLLGVWLMGEHIGGFEWLALLAILGGVVLVLTAKES